jgi:hypothetical protein
MGWHIAKNETLYILNSLVAYFCFDNVKEYFNSLTILLFCQVSFLADEILFAYYYSFIAMKNL